MIDSIKIKGHMEVVGADGVHVGRVDRMDGEWIRLTRHHSVHGVRVDCHRYVRLGDVASLDGGRVWLARRGSAVKILDRSASRQAPKQM